MQTHTDMTKLVHGRVSLWRLRKPGREARGYLTLPEVEFLAQQPNQLQYGWGAIAARCMGLADRKYAIKGMYIEYENVVNPNDAVAAPTYAREDGLEYYQNLSVSSVRDFLRVPLTVTPQLSIASGYEDYFDGEVTGNKLTFFAQTQGITGFHGKNFSAAANSKVFGAALVATPDFQDPTQDLIFARMYYTSGNQQVKQSSSQFGLGWEVTFN